MIFIIVVFLWQSHGEFRVTHLILPQQTGKPDSFMDESHEDELFSIQDKYDVTQLGWIHVRSIPSCCPSQLSRCRELIERVMCCLCTCRRIQHKQRFCPVSINTFKRLSSACCPSRSRSSAPRNTKSQSCIFILLYNSRLSSYFFLFLILHEQFVRH